MVRIYDNYELSEGEIYNTVHCRKPWGVELYPEPFSLWEEQHNKNAPCGKLDKNDYFVLLEKRGLDRRSLKILSRTGSVGWTTRLYPAFVKEADIEEYKFVITSEEECEVIHTPNNNIVGLSHFISEMRVRIVEQTKTNVTVETIPGLVCKVKKGYLKVLV